MTNTPSVEGDRLEAIADLIGYHLARLVSRNPMPAISGDPRDQIPAHERGRFARACKDAARQIDALPCKGGEAMTREEAEARIATLRRDQAWQARWMAGGQDERALWKRLTAIASGQVFATPSTEPDTGRGLSPDVIVAVRSIIDHLIAREMNVETWDLHRIRRALASPPHGGRILEGWRDIESAPKDGTHVLLYAGEQTYQGKPVEPRLTYGYWLIVEHGKYIGDCGGECRCPEYNDPPEPSWWSDDGGFTVENPPTHWMPLPAAPVSPLREDKGASRAQDQQSAATSLRSDPTQVQSDG